jgi:hypothetical protein
MSKFSISSNLNDSHLNQSPIEVDAFYASLNLTVRCLMMLNAILQNKDVKIAHPDFNYPNEFYSVHLITLMRDHADKCWKANLPLYDDSVDWKLRTQENVLIRDSSGLALLFHYIILKNEGALNSMIHGLYERKYLRKKRGFQSKTVSSPSPQEVHAPAASLTLHPAPSLMDDVEEDSLLADLLDHPTVPSTTLPPVMVQQAPTNCVDSDESLELHARPKKRRAVIENSREDSAQAAQNESQPPPEDVISAHVLQNVANANDDDVIVIHRPKRMSKTQQKAKQFKLKYQLALQEGRVVDLRSDSSSSDEVKIVRRGNQDA